MFEVAGLGFLWVEKHDVDVAERADLGPSVATDCDDGDRHIGAFIRIAIDFEGTVGEESDDFVEQDGEAVGDFKPSASFEMTFFGEGSSGFDHSFALPHRFRERGGRVEVQLFGC